MNRARRVLSTFLATAFLAACGGGGDGPTNPGGGQTPAISITLSGATLNLTAGASGQITVSVTRSGGFTGAVAVSADVPAGVTAQPLTIAAGSSSGALTFQVAGSATAGTSSVTIRATGQGVQQVTASLSLIIAAAPTADFGVALGQAAATLIQGGTVTVPVQITRTNFTGAVTLSATGLPQGVTAAFDPGAPTGTASTLTLTASAGAATGAASVTVQGAGAPGNRTATLALTVEAPAPVGDFTLSLNPASLQFQQGAGATTTVTVARSGGFTGPVALTATGLPQGVTAAFNPASVTGTTSTLTLTAAAGATVGSGTVTVEATATGLAPRSASLGVTVSMSGGGGSGNVSWAFCDPSDIPTWFAFRDGNGPWARVMVDAQNRFRFQVNADRAALAWVDVETGGADLNVFHFHRDELLLATQDACQNGTPEGKTVNGSVTALGATESAFISLGGSSAFLFGAQGLNFTLENVPEGPQDLVAGRIEFNIGTGSLIPNRLLARRGVDAPDNSTLPPLDFDGEGFDPAMATLTVTGALTGEEISSTGLFTTQRGGLGSYYAGIQGGATTTYWGFPTNRLEAGDLHYLRIVAVDPNQAGSTPPPTRQVGAAFREVQNRTVALGPVHVAPTITSLASAPYARVRAQWTLQQEYRRSVTLFLNQDGATSRDVIILASNRFLEGATDVSLEVPDFAGVDGWNDQWGPQGGVSTIWSVTGTGWQGQGFINFPELLDGTLFLSGSRSGTITP